MASPPGRASSNIEGQAIPKLAKKILADLLISLADVEIID